MYNWSINLKELKKDKKKFAIWKLEQLINFGLGKEKIQLSDLKKYWSQINIDPDRRKFLKFLIYDRKNPY